MIMNCSKIKEYRHRVCSEFVENKVSATRLNGLICLVTALTADMLLCQQRDDLCTYHISNDGYLEDDCVGCKLGLTDGAGDESGYLKGPPLKRYHQISSYTILEELTPPPQALPAPPSPRLLM